MTKGFLRFLQAVSVMLATSATVARADQPGVAPVYLGGAWSLAAIDAQHFAALATIDLSEPGRATGRAPCNRWFASVEGDLPAFKIGPAGSTKMACDDLVAERAFFTALAEMTEARAEADTLMLTGNGRTMEFRHAAD